jgi:hypothetical protein
MVSKNDLRIHVDVNDPAVFEKAFIQVAITGRKR